MKVVTRKLSEIFPYAQNPRHNDAAVEAVARSIQEFGFRQPIVIDGRGVIVAGDTRYKAAQNARAQDRARSRGHGTDARTDPRLSHRRQQAR